MNANLIQLGIVNNRADISTGAVLSKDSPEGGNFEQVFREVKEINASQSPSSAKPQARESEESKEAAPLAASKKPETEKTDGSTNKELAQNKKSGDDTAQVSADAQTATENPQSGEEEAFKQTLNTEAKNENDAESQAAWDVIQLSLALMNFTPVDTEKTLSPLQDFAQIAGSQEILLETPNIQASMNIENAAKSMEDAMFLSLGENASSENLSLFTENQAVGSTELDAFFSNAGKIQSSRTSDFLSSGISAEGLTESKNPDSILSNAKVLSDTEAPQIQTAQIQNSEIQDSLKPNKENLFPLSSTQEKNPDKLEIKNPLDAKPAMDKVPNAGENPVSGQNDPAEASHSAKSSSESLAMKPAIQSIGMETPKEVKSSGNENNSAFSVSKSSGHNAVQSFVEASSFQNAGENGVNDQASAGNKFSTGVEASTESGNAKFDFHSLLPNENTVSGPKGTSENTFNITSSVMGELRMKDLSNTSSLKAENTIDWKPQEVLERSVVDQIVSKATFTSKNGQSEMRIQLDPPSLGTVKVQITVEGEKVSANVLADNSIARDIIERNIQHLRNSLSEQGLKVEHMSVNVGNDSKQPGAGQERPFFMEREFSQKNPLRNNEYDTPEPAIVSSVKNNFNRDGGISIFI